MKITSVDIFLLRHVGEEFSPFPFRPAVCRVNTDEGICGYNALKAPLPGVVTEIKVAVGDEVKVGDVVDRKSVV